MYFIELNDLRQFNYRIKFYMKNSLSINFCKNNQYSRYKLNLFILIFKNIIMLKFVDWRIIFCILAVH